MVGDPICDVDDGEAATARGLMFCTGGFDRSAARVISLEESAADSLLLLPVLLLLPFPLPPPTPLALLELVFEFLVLDLLAEEDFLLDLASVEVFAV